MRTQAGNRMNDIALITILVGIAIVVILLFKKKNNNATTATKILLCGPCNSGKTTIIYGLQDTPLETCTSSNVNNALIQLHNKKIYDIVDFPGHPRLRHSLDSHLQKSQALIFVIDSTESAAEAAEFLFRLLTNPLIEKKKLLLLFNKTDCKGAAKSESSLIKEIDTEINRLRKTETTHLDKGDESLHYLCAEDEDFHLLTTQCCDLNIMSISAKKGSLDPVIEYIQQQ